MLCLIDISAVVAAAAGADQVDPARSRIDRELRYAKTILMGLIMGSMRMISKSAPISVGT